LPVVAPALPANDPATANIEPQMASETFDEDLL
jgi:hypothetical protein